MDRACRCSFQASHIYLPLDVFSDLQNKSAHLMTVVEDFRPRLSICKTHVPKALMLVTVHITLKIHSYYLSKLAEIFSQIIFKKQSDI